MTEAVPQAFSCFYSFFFPRRECAHSDSHHSRKGSGCIVHAAADTTDPIPGSALGQDAGKIKAQNPQNNALRGCHLTDIKYFLTECFRKTQWQHLSQMLGVWGLRIILHKLRRAWNGLEVRAKIRIEWQLVEIFISASLQAPRSYSTEIKQMKTNCKEKPSRKYEYTHDDVGNEFIGLWAFLSTCRSSSNIQTHTSQVTSQRHKPLSKGTGTHRSN